MNIDCSDCFSWLWGLFMMVRLGDRHTKPGVQNGLRWWEYQASRGSRYRLSGMPRKVVRICLKEPDNERVEAWRLGRCIHNKIISDIPNFFFSLSRVCSTA